MATNEYRVTRPKLYDHSCSGHTSLGSRQGHYVVADTPEEAVRRIALDFEDNFFDVQEKIGMVYIGSYTREGVRMGILEGRSTE